MKTVLITGVSRGIGKALAERFLANGDEVIGTSTSGTAEIQNPNLTVVELDLARPESIQKAAEQITALGKKIDILINNAAVMLRAERKKANLDPMLLRQTLEVNLVGTVDFTERVLPLLCTGAHIVNVSSRAGSLGDFTNHFKYPSYNISKAALNMFTRYLASTHKDRLRASSVFPGWVRTDMGGSDATLSPEEAAEDIFKLANTEVATGQFWYKDRNFPW